MYKKIKIPSCLGLSHIDNRNGGTGKKQKNSRFPKVVRRNFAMVVRFIIM